MHDGRTASKCLHVCLVINLNQQLQCDKFFQFTKFLIRITKIYSILSEYTNIRV